MLHLCVSKYLDMSMRGASFDSHCPVLPFLEIIPQRVFSQLSMWLLNITIHQSWMFLRGGGGSRGDGLFSHLRKT